MRLLTKGLLHLFSFCLASKMSKRKVVSDYEDRLRKVPRLNGDATSHAPPPISSQPVAASSSSGATSSVTSSSGATASASGSSRVTISAPTSEALETSNGYESTVFATTLLNRNLASSSRSASSGAWGGEMDEVVRILYRIRLPMILISLLW